MKGNEIRNTGRARDRSGDDFVPEVVARIGRDVGRIRKRPMTVVLLVWALLFLLLGLANAYAQTRKAPLDEKDNPELIGKRNINKGQIDFYSLEKERALGRQLAAEVDRSSKFVEDPVIVEYVNRVGQNLVLHSDAKVPFIIKVIDSNEINAFALPGGFVRQPRRAGSRGQ